MNSISDLIYDVNDMLAKRVKDMTVVSPVKLGLDAFAGHQLYIDKECIIIYKDYDRSFQYYGGAKYVDTKFRQEIGNYVIYLPGDERVQGWLEYYYDKGEED